jgi:acyl carrier protein
MRGPLMTAGNNKGDAQTVVRLVAGTLGVSPDELSLDSSMDNTPAWDSVEHLNICMAFERQFGVKLNMDNVISATSIRALASLIP